MAIATPTRQALTELPINTLGTPSTKSILGKERMGTKRPLQEVAEPEYSQPVSRLRVSPRSQKNRQHEPSQVEVLPAQASEADSPSTRVLSPPVVQPDVPNPAVGPEEMEEGDSQTSFNSIIDFDPDDTLVSQQTAATETTQPPQSRVRQHVETLRLRLRLAHFKVRTNQINIPLSQLRISTDHQSPSSPNHQPSLPKLLPAPVLRPTAYSARTITQPQIPSSPPSSPESIMADVTREDVFRTPALPRQRTAMGSRPDDSPNRSPRRIGVEEDTLTSSAVRGKAAIGLLGLRLER